MVAVDSCNPFLHVPMIGTCCRSVENSMWGHANRLHFDSMCCRVFTICECCSCLLRGPRAPVGESMLGCKRGFETERAAERESDQRPGVAGVVVQAVEVEIETFGCSVYHTCSVVLLQTYM